MANSSFIKIGKLTASQMLSLSNSVIAGLTATVGTYPAPNPTVITLTADTLSLSQAIMNRGRKSTPGGALPTATLKNAMEVIQADLIALAQYCMTTTPNSQLDFLSAGFPTYFIHAAGFKAKRTQQRPRNVRALVRRDVDATSAYIKWKRPLGQHKPIYTKPIQNVWRVMRSETPDAAGFAQVAVTTKTQFTDQLGDRVAPAGGYFYYKVILISRDGSSVESDIVKFYYNKPA